MARTRLRWQGWFHLEHVGSFLWRVLEVEDWCRWEGQGAHNGGCVVGETVLTHFYSEQVCLFGPPVLSLRPLLRSPSATDDGLLQQIGSAVWGKKFAHDGLGGASGIQANGKMGPMVGIGG